MEGVVWYLAFEVKVLTRPNCGVKKKQKQKQTNKKKQQNRREGSREVEARLNCCWFWFRMCLSWRDFIES